MPTLYSIVNETGNRNRILEMCKFQIWIRLGITSTILHRFSPNFAIGSGISSHRRLFVTQTGSSLLIFRGVRILISAVFRLWWAHLSTDQHQIPCTDKIRQCRLRIRWRMKPEIETGILERCKFRFWLLHWIDPRSIEHNYACIKFLFHRTSETS